MSTASMLPRVYTLLDCPKCEVLKGWLSDKQIDFDVKPFDTEAQTDFIMRNMFGKWTIDLMLGGPPCQA